ncbi:MAG: hypothetical protein DRP01_00240 [Archaeoglobales archaeon]|nr:MAG: hypothetical protein DRP01_00240 [Archaeoglobales archaeon]
MSNGYNPMQANLGLMSGQGSRVMTPSDIATSLSQQASAQLSQAESMSPVARGGGSSFNFGQQFQAQLGQIQQQQSLGVYQAAMMAGAMPGAQGYSGGMVPSPLTMTPPSTGAFRPPAPPPMMAPISPTPIMPVASTPLTPRAPSPIFQTAWDQEVRQREARADQLFAYQAQAPRAIGQGAGYGIGALAGGMLGARFGGLGKIAGAAIGAGAAHFSGAAQGLGDVSMLPMQSTIQAHSMGAALQRSSQDWVVSGPQLHPLGRGLNRGASQQLASGIQSMAEDSSFQQSTGGMFNQKDLMKITQLSGQAGLMDMEQSIPGIQQNLRRVSQAISSFMELTNQPDVVTVVKQMGQLRQLGFGVDQMDEAAQGMRSFSRAAGTSIQGAMQQYGMPGAMTYQQAGLMAGPGMQYGMYSGATARQGVAGGVYNTQQLSMLGGVGGIAQRNMQAQAAMLSMPLFGAAAGQYGAGGWGMNANSLAQMGSSGSGGAQGMVLNAVQNMGNAVQSGGVGAMAMFGLQQRQVQSQAANAMTPYEQTVMRFRMARETGQGLGLKGAGAFAVGAQSLFGKEVAEQMMIEASDPDHWRQQRDMISRRQEDISRQQRDEIREAAPGMFGQIAGAVTPKDTTMRNVKDAWLRPFGKLSRIIGEGMDDSSDFKRRNSAWEEGRLYSRTPTEFIASSKSARRAQEQWEAGATGEMLGGTKGVGGLAQADPIQAYHDVMSYQDRRGPEGSAHVAGGMSAKDIDQGIEFVGTVLDYATPAGLASAVGGFDMSDILRHTYGTGLSAAHGNQYVKKAGAFASGRTSKTRQMFKGMGGASRTGEASAGMYSNLEKAFGLEAGTGFQTVSGVGARIGVAAREGDSVFGDAFSDRIDQGTARNAAIQEMAGRSGKSIEEATRIYDSLSEQDRAGFESLGVKNALETGSAETKEAISRAQELSLGSEARRQSGYTQADMKMTQMRMRKFESALGIPEGEQTEKYREFTKQGTGSELMMAALESGANLTGEQREVFERMARQKFMKERGFESTTSKEFQVAFNKAQSDVGKGYMGGKEVFDSDARTRLRTILESKGMQENAQHGAAALAGHQVLQRGQISQAQQAAAVSKVINPLIGGTVTGVDDFERLGKEDLSSLIRGGHRGIVEQVAVLQGQGSAEEKSEARANIQRMLSSAGQGLVEETEETTIRKGMGREYSDLQRSHKAVGGIGAELGEDFRPAGKGVGAYFNEESTKNFKEGAEALNEAANAMQAAALRVP